jgi:hypothetical protein
MSLGKQMVEQLRLLATNGSVVAKLHVSGDAHNVLTVVEAGKTATLELFDHDRYSVSMHALEVGIDAPPPDDAHAYLSAHAAEIARRLSYLEEPLAVWELDGGEKLAQLRSSPPQREGEEICYWEVSLHAGPQPSARIMRYRWIPGMVEREVVAYPATFALVGRMLDSLVEGLELAKR